MGSGSPLPGTARCRLLPSALVGSPHEYPHAQASTTLKHKLENMTDRKRDHRRKEKIISFLYGGDPMFSFCTGTHELCSWSSMTLNNSITWEKLRPRPRPAKSESAFLQDPRMIPVLSCLRCTAPKMASTRPDYLILGFHMDLKLKTF